MKINHKIKFVNGPFETEDGKIVSVGSKKYGEVQLCFKANMNVPFASIKLYTRDLAVDADAVFKDAENLGEEISRRWNEFNWMEKELSKISNPNTEDYVPYGAEWKKEMMKVKKEDILDMYQKNMQHTNIIDSSTEEGCKHHIDGILNDFESGLITKDQAFHEIGKYTYRLMDIFNKNIKEKGVLK